MTTPLPRWPLDVTARTPAPATLAGAALPDRIALLRRHRVEGLTVAFQPYGREFGDSLRTLRNLPANKAGLAQAADITPEGQRAWEDGYFARTDDLCWILLLPGPHPFAGSVSLYDIGAESAETGRLVVREEAARSTPVIAECELMVQWLAFAWLGLPRITARVQPGNAKMVAMHERLGFRVTGPSEIRGVPYLRLEAGASDFRPEPHARVLRHAQNRAAGRNPGSTPGG